MPLHSHIYDTEGMASAIAAWDWVVIGVYFIAVIGVAVWAMWSNRKKGTSEEVDGYFLGGRGFTWITVGASLFGSNIGSTVRSRIL